MEETETCLGPFLHSQNAPSDLISKALEAASRTIAEISNDLPDYGFLHF